MIFVSCLYFIKRFNFILPHLHTNAKSFDRFILSKYSFSTKKKYTYKCAELCSVIISYEQPEVESKQLVLDWSGLWQFAVFQSISITPRRLIVDGCRRLFVNKSSGPLSSWPRHYRNDFRFIVCESGRTPHRRRTHFVTHF